MEAFRNAEKQLQIPGFNKINQGCIANILLLQKNQCQKLYHYNGERSNSVREQRMHGENEKRIYETLEIRLKLEII